MLVGRNDSFLFTPGDVDGYTNFFALVLSIEIISSIESTGVCGKEI